MMGKRWEEMRDSIAKDLTNADQIARSIAFGHMPEVYAINHDYGTFQIENASLLDTSYTLYDRQAMEQLMKDNDQTFIPAPGRKVTQAINEGKAMAWNRKQVQSAMMQSLLQGESIPDIATRLAKTVGESDRKAAIRNARTMTTGIENAGRMASYKRANDMGIETQKQWLATLDSRTRHWHSSLDGVKVDNDKPFTNEYGDIMYPGDPAADPSNIFNCRCTLIASIKGFERDVSDMDLRHDDNLGDMTYDEWRAGKYDQTSDPITKQDDIAEIMKRKYGEEYAEYAGNRYILNDDEFKTKYSDAEIDAFKKELENIDKQIQELRKQEEDITGYKHDEYLEYLKKNGSSVDKEFEGYEDEKKAYDDIQDQIRKLEEQKKAIPYDAIEEIDKTIEKQPEDGIIKTDRDYDSDLCKGLGKEHYDNIHDKLDNCGDEDFIRVWNANEKDIRVADASSGKNYANDKGIYINEEKDAKGNAAKEPYQSTIHESAHRIDRLNADKGSGEGNHFSSTYQDGAFLDAISSDVKNLIDDREKIILKAIEDHPGDWKWLYSNNYIDAWAYDLAKMGGEVKYERRWAENLLVKEIKSLPKKTQSSLSDIVEGATMGRVIVLGGHKQTYWKDHLFKGINEGLATETNSHFAETIGANHEAYNYLKKWMPKTNDIWHEMMKALASK